MSARPPSRVSRRPATRSPPDRRRYGIAGPERAALERAQAQQVEQSTSSIWTRTLFGVSTVASESTIGEPARR